MNDLKIEDRVQVKYNHLYDKEYEFYHVDERKKHDKDTGIIVDSDEGHGTCYKIQFAFGSAWYESNELSKIEPETNSKIEWIGKCKLRDASDRLIPRETETIKVRITFCPSTKGIRCEQRIPTIEDTPQYQEISLDMLDIYSVVKMIGENIK